MEFIPPLEIASKIMTLIQDAEKELIIVSPYISIEKWHKMKKWIQNAVDKKIAVKFYVRADANHDLSFIRQLNIPIEFIENLHAKIYLNEKYGIVSSQNLTYSSDVNSIDIGYRTESQKEQVELITFITKYLDKNDSMKRIVISEPHEQITKQDVDFIPNLLLAFSEKFKDAKFTKTDTYIFSGNLVTGVDLMISEEYTVKSFKKNIQLINYFEGFKNSNFLKQSNWDVAMNFEHAKYLYITLKPTKMLEPTILVSTFIELTEVFQKDFG